MNKLKELLVINILCFIGSLTWYFFMPINIIGGIVLMSLFGCMFSVIAMMFE